MDTHTLTDSSVRVHVYIQNFKIEFRRGVGAVITLAFTADPMAVRAVRIGTNMQRVHPKQSAIILIDHAALATAENETPIHPIITNWFDWWSSVSIKESHCHVFTKMTFVDPLAETPSYPTQCIWCRIASGSSHIACPIFVVHHHVTVFKTAQLVVTFETLAKTTTSSTATPTHRSAIVIIVER